MTQEAAGILVADVLRWLEERNEEKVNDAAEKMGKVWLSDRGEREAPLVVDGVVVVGS